MVSVKVVNYIPHMIEKHGSVFNAQKEEMCNSISRVYQSNYMMNWTVLG